MSVSLADSEATSLQEQALVASVQTWVFQCAPWWGTGRQWGLRWAVWGPAVGSGAQAQGQGLCLQQGVLAQRAAPLSVWCLCHTGLGPPGPPGPAEVPRSPCWAAVAGGPGSSPQWAVRIGRRSARPTGGGPAWRDRRGPQKRCVGKRRRKKTEKKITLRLAFHPNISYL